MCVLCVCVYVYVCVVYVYVCVVYVHVHSCAYVPQYNVFVLCEVASAYHKLTRTGHVQHGLPVAKPSNHRGTRGPDVS